VVLPDLGRRFEFYPGTIAAAVARATAEAGMRGVPLYSQTTNKGTSNGNSKEAKEASSTTTTATSTATSTASSTTTSSDSTAAKKSNICEIRQKDLMNAAEAEDAKLKAANYELMSKLFT